MADADIITILSRAYRAFARESNFSLDDEATENGALRLTYADVGEDYYFDAKLALSDYDIDTDTLTHHVGAEYTSSKGALVQERAYEVGGVLVVEEHQRRPQGEDPWSELTVSLRQMRPEEVAETVQAMKHRIVTQVARPVMNSGVKVETLARIIDNLTSYNLGEADRALLSTKIDTLVRIAAGMRGDHETKPQEQRTAAPRPKL